MGGSFIAAKSAPPIGRRNSLGTETFAMKQPYFGVEVEPQEGLNNPVANESAGLMITQTFIIFILRQEVFIFECFIIYPFPPTQFGVLFGFDGIISFDGIME